MARTGIFFVEAHLGLPGCVGNSGPMLTYDSMFRLGPRFLLVTQPDPRFYDRLADTPLFLR
jgi:hypothetical protein